MSSERENELQIPLSFNFISPRKEESLRKETSSMLLKEELSVEDDFDRELAFLFFLLHVIIIILFFIFVPIKNNHIK